MGYINISTHSNQAEFRNILNNLNAEIAQIKVRSAKGLIMAAAHIRVETEKTPYITPLDLGNLRASWFIVSAKGKTGDPIGKSEKFKGPKASELSSDYVATIAEGQGEVASYGKGVAVMMGYSANYAMWVHEMIGATFHRKGGQSGPKWFESAVYRNKDKIVQIVKGNAQIKK